MNRKRVTVVRRIGALAATLPFLGALVWSGCGSNQDRYYCDSSGCYSCDGYGCSTVTPPTNPPCTGNTSCPSGSTCTSNGCELGCQSNGDCPQGDVCTSGACVPPGKQPGSPVGCTTTADCTAGSVCVSNQCETCGGTSGPCPCKSTSDCGSGFSCANGACTPTSDTCKYSSDCPTGKVCDNGQCVEQCSLLSCPQGQSCVNGVCQSSSSGPSCTSDQNCSGSTPKCVSGQCAPACTKDSDCPSGDYCNQGACVIDTRPAPSNCSTNADCKTNPPQVCQGGFCRYECTTNAQCEQIDSRIGFCSQTDKVCRTQAEANPQCTQQSDCPSGQNCIGNVCQ
jgi:hypothetical protein